MGTIQHIFCRNIATGERRQLRIGQCAIDWMDLTLTDLGVFGIAAVTLTAKVTGFIEIHRITPVAEPAVDQHPLSDEYGISLLPHRHHDTGNIRTLYSWKTD